MPRNTSRAASRRTESWPSGVMDMARDRPVAAAAVAAGAAAAGLFLWSKRNQVTQQLNQLSDQIGNWTQNMTTGASRPSAMDDTTGTATSKTSSSARSPSAAIARRSGTPRKSSGTGSPNSRLGARSAAKAGAGNSPSASSGMSDSTLG